MNDKTKNNNIKNNTSISIGRCMKKARTNLEATRESILCDVSERLGAGPAAGALQSKTPRHKSQDRV